MPNEGTHRLIRILQCLVVAAVTSAIIIPVTAWLLDRHERFQQVKVLKERESRALGGGRTPSPENFDPMEVVPRPPLVRGFSVVRATDISDQLRDDEFVLGAVVGGQARAWPLNVMTGPDREVFNDVLGGRSIAATW